MFKSKTKFINFNPQITNSASNSYFLDNSDSFFEGLRIGKNNLESCTYTKILHLKRNSNFSFLINQCQLLAGYGLVSKVSSNSIPLSPEMGGWQAIVDQIHNDTMLGLEQPYGIGLYVYVNSKFRGQGIAGKIIQSMKKYCLNSGIHTLYIPLLLPSSKSEKHFDQNIEDYFDLKREDGQYQDFWLRLHVKNGAKIIRTDQRSHRFCVDQRLLNNSYYSQVGIEVNKKGSDYHIKSQSNNYLFKHMHGSDIYICNVPCVWVKYDINQI